MCCWGSGASHFISGSGLFVFRVLKAVCLFADSACARSRGFDAFFVLAVFAAENGIFDRFLGTIFVAQG